MSDGPASSAEARARRALPHVWHAFFGRFGRLTEAQTAAIEPVAAGESVVLCAATASGKTEALLGPMIERCLARDSKSGRLRVVVVCPTRALCNDFLRRVRRPIQACNWTVDLKSGDDPSFSADNPPDVLVTTPESLDSLLSRQPAGLKHVDALFLDEVHLLAGGARGDHLRALVARLQSFRPDVQIGCASATAAAAEELAVEFAGPTAKVLRVAGGRDRQLAVELEQVITPGDAARAVMRLALAEPGSKVLVFANTRAEVEWLAASLAQVSGLRSFAHHGSLSKPERLRAEKGFLEAPSGVCVATMTLELGIDIGDVDRAVLLNPPPNVASFTQRIGRSNRRGGDIQVTCLYSTEFDRLRFLHLIACAQAGRLFVEPTAFRPSILPQQAVSLMFQNPKGWVSAGALYARLPADVRDLYNEADCQAVLDAMRAAGYLHADARGRFVADEPARRDYRYGRIHAHIAADAEVEVVDEATGRTLGTAKWSRQEQARSEAQGDGLLLGGKQRKVTRVRDQRVFVETDELDEAPSFLTRMGPRYSFALARDLAEFIGLADNEIRLMPTGGTAGQKEWRVEHFFGTLWGRLLAAILRDRGFSVVGVGAFHLTARRRGGAFPERLGAPTRIEADVEDYLKAGYRELQKPLQPGPWARFVPADLLRRWVRECVRPPEFADALADMRLLESDG